MIYRPDIAISDPAGSPIAFVEVKALRQLDVQTATRYVRNLLAHGFSPRIQYIMLITPDTGYLWTNPEAVLHEKKPDLEFPMHRITQHYAPRNGAAAQIRGVVLESIVRQWLSDLADGASVDDGVTDELRAYGFIDSVHNGLIHSQESV